HWDCSDECLGACPEDLFTWERFPGFSWAHFNGAYWDMHPFRLPILFRASVLIAGVLWGILLEVGAVEPALTVAQLRALPKPAFSKSDSANGYPVELDGVVTYLRTTERDFNFNLEDGTGGVMVYSSGRAALTPGQRVRVKGSATIGRTGLNVLNASLTLGEVVGFPQPLPASIMDLLSGRFEGRFVEVEASVRRVRLEGLQPQRLALDLGPQAHPLSAWITHYQGAEGRFSSGMIVRLRGVCVRWVNLRGQPISTSLFVNSVEDVSDLLPPSDPPVSSLMEVQEWVGSDETAPRMACLGTVTFHRPGELTVIQEGNRAIRVRPGQSPVQDSGAGTSTIVPGDKVEVVGFPVMGEYTIELEYAEIRKLSKGDKVTPEPLADAKQAVMGAGVLDRDGRLVQMTAEVRGVRERDSETVLELVSGDKAFPAYLRGGPVPVGVREGARVRLSGVCSLHVNPTERRLGIAPKDFSLLLPEPASLELIQRAPWWTSRYLGVALGGFVGIATLTAAWAVVVGRKNAALRREIAARIAAEDRLDEDRRRVAADLHDTLQQTLLAADLQLNAALRTIPVKPQAALPLVELAGQLLKRSRGEVRDAVWDLNTETSEVRSLSGLLRQACDEASTPSSLEVLFSVEGREPELSALVISQCVRVVREAITNALKHGEAQLVSVSLNYQEGDIRLEVKDDGIGFEPNRALGPESGHFGIAGMRERLRRLDGKMELESAPGKGTVLRFMIPISIEI
ncbi:MAG: ATP-binding protein, partial [Verrucomicrobiota bacterium]